MVGEGNPKSVLVPAGVVHGIVINCTYQLYMGEANRDEIDEIRHEDPETLIFYSCGRGLRLGVERGEDKKRADLAERQSLATARVVSSARSPEPR